MRRLILAGVAVLGLAACTPKQLEEWLPSSSNPAVNGVTDPAMDGAGGVVYLLDSGTGFCYGIGVRYLSVHPEIVDVPCPVKP